MSSSTQYLCLFNPCHWGHVYSSTVKISPMLISLPLDLNVALAWLPSESRGISKLYADTNQNVLQFNSSKCNHFNPGFTLLQTQTLLSHSFFQNLNLVGQISLLFFFWTDIICIFHSNGTCLYVWTKR